MSLDSASYPILNCQDVPAYIDRQPALRDRVGRVLSVNELSEGNINLVFRVVGNAGRLILKQGLPYVRIVGSWNLTPDRVRHEALAYRTWRIFAPDLVPACYNYDPENYIAAVEDLHDAVVWRHALMAGQVHSAAAGAMGRLVAKTAFFTSVFSLPRDEIIVRATEAANPEMCKLIEDLVFTEPYTQHEHNDYGAEIASLVAAIRRDTALLAQVARLKYEYLTRAEALLHGDLHTGSVLVRDGSYRAIDTEFGFYGPIAYDVGLLWGNFLMAWIRARVLEEPQAAEIEGLAVRFWDALVFEMRCLWPGRVDRSFTNDNLTTWLQQVSHNGIGFAGCEIARRVINIGHVEDLEELPAAERRAANRAALQAARAWIHNHQTIGSPQRALDIAREVIRPDLDQLGGPGLDRS